MRANGLILLALAVSIGCAGQRKPVPPVRILELDRPIVVTLQGEAPFLDSLPDPFKQQAWHQLRDASRAVTAFVPVSHDYGNLMTERLEIARDRVHVIHNGINLDDFEQTPAPLDARTPQTIGYLARMCRDKGLPTLVDAFLVLLQRGTLPDLRLRIAGVQLKEDRALVDQLRARIRAAGADDRVEFLPNISRADKLTFLASLHVLSVPATYGESFGLYILEALAAGVPVVQPRHGAFPEILELTNGGTLYDFSTFTPTGLALANAGRCAVVTHFSSQRMAQDFQTLCHSLKRT